MLHLTPSPLSTTWIGLTWCWPLCALLPVPAMPLHSFFPRSSSKSRWIWTIRQTGRPLNASIECKQVRRRRSKGTNSWSLEFYALTWKRLSIVHKGRDNITTIIMSNKCVGSEKGKRGYPETKSNSLARRGPGENGGTVGSYNIEWMKRICWKKDF